eukprot:CAMPEP_0184664454 /NCGR_PEP_ID=MMETSP0308-20130426/52868_1 /TAXON_ID=38269 /ORGANISM="Gloeochaete witrockiana, Strain SAG 46.84" /LENGTH=377 /DNA_ID=CAMNT_0027107857 /DNA_START=66 /DNA_END=1199 /DNA_ORIENTATION=-
MQLGDLLAAGSNFRRTLKLSPGHSKAKADLARTYDILGNAEIDKANYEVAVSFLTFAIEANPLALYYFRRATAHFKLERLGEAMYDLNECIGLDGSVVEAHLLRARLFLRFRNVTSAGSDVTAVLNADPNNKEALQLDRMLKRETDNLVSDATALILESQPKAAAQVLTQALLMEPNDLQAMVKRGVALRHAGDFPAAIEDFKSVIQRCTGDSRDEASRQLAVTFNEMGVMLYSKKFYDKALQCFDSAIGSDSSLASYFINRGDCLQQLQDDLGARADFSKALEFEPGNRNVRMRLGMLSDKEGADAFNRCNYHQAWLHYGEAARYCPGVWLYHWNRYQASSRMNRLDLQKVDLENVIRLNPDHVQAQSQLKQLKRT